MADDKKETLEETQNTDLDTENHDAGALDSEATESDERERRVASKLKAAVTKDDEKKSPMESLNELFDEDEDEEEEENDPEAEADYAEEDDSNDDPDVEDDEDENDEEVAAKTLTEEEDTDVEEVAEESAPEVEADDSDEDEDELEEEEEDTDDDEARARAEEAAAEAAAQEAKEKAAKKKSKKGKKSSQSKKSNDDSKEEEESKKGGASKESKEGKKKKEKGGAKKDSAKKTDSDTPPEEDFEPRRGDVVAGVFTPNKPYTPPKELDDSERFIDPTRVSGVKWFLAALVILLICAGIVYVSAERPSDIQDVFLGQLRAKRAAARERKEEEHRLAELKKLNKFGTLVIQGDPQYATIKFDGKERYGITESGTWRALNLQGNVPIKNLNLKKEFEITVESPGFKPITEKVTEGRWQENPQGGDASLLIGANLEPLSALHKREFDQRLAPDTETEFFGTVTITSEPAGGFVIFDNKPLKDAEGKDLVTPVTFSANYIFNEETKAYEEEKIKVDTVLDVGHKIEVGFHYPNTCKEGQVECVNDDGCCPKGPKCNVANDTDCKYPTIVAALQRQNWQCTFDEEKLEQTVKDLDEGKLPPSAIQEICNYTFTLNANLEEVKKYAREQEAERLRIERLNAEINGELETPNDENAAE